LVEVSIVGRGPSLSITVDGEPHQLSSIVGPPWVGVALDQPSPLEREYQVDGSDTTATDDRARAAVAAQLDTPLYALDAWLRDEASYSRWERVQIEDLQTGQVVAALPPGTASGPGLTTFFAGPLPAAFRLTAGLRRPEAAARLWLVGEGADRREGLELDRDRRNARWIIQRDRGRDALPRWFFPEHPAPFAAGLLHLVGRAAAAGYVLGLVCMGLGRVLAGRWPGGWRIEALGRPVAIDLMLGVWLIGAALVTTRLYHQLPHILDAVSYTFQAGQFAVGHLALAAPPVAAAFKGPFTVELDGRIFSQYPPGAPLAYALGQLVGLQWLVGPLACLALIGATSWTAGALYGRATGVLVAGLGVLSPFILFQAGSFLSHPVAGGLLAGALAAFIAGECRGRGGWFVLSGALLGASAITREAATLLFALPLGARLVLTRNVSGAMLMAGAGLPFVGLYLMYNAALTGSPTLLPRALFDASDRFGFGTGVGFHTRHTLAAGLANTDELLTVLQFELFGWPPLVALGLLGVPLLFGRARTWDLLATGGVLAFVAADAAYFYHGIALGPRYYFEALPWLLLLAGRGGQVLAGLGRSRVAVGIVLGVLAVHTLAVYVPAEWQRRADLGGMAGGRRVSLDFVEPTLVGPRLRGVPAGTLVVSDDWWLFNTSLAALNCGRLPDCDVLFALATNPPDVERLRAAYPDRGVLYAVDTGGQVVLRADARP
jgi:hypothetical protein